MMNIAKTEKSLTKSQFLSHFVRFPMNKFSSQAKQLKLKNLQQNCNDLKVKGIHKQLIQLNIQKIYLYLICYLNKSQLYLSEKVYLSKQGLIFMFFDLSDKYRKRLLKKDTKIFGKNVIQIYNQLKKLMQSLNYLESQRMEELQKYINMKMKSIQEDSSAIDIIKQLQMLQIFKENSVLLGYIQNSILKVARDHKSILSKYFIQFNLLKIQSYQMNNKKMDQYQFLNIIKTVKRFLQTASESIKIRLMPTSDEFQNNGNYEKTHKFNSNRDTFLKKNCQQFILDYAYQSREVIKQTQQFEEMLIFQIVQDKFYLRAEISQQGLQSGLQLNISANFDWKILGIDFVQFQVIYNQIISQMSEVESISQIDNFIKKDIRQFKVGHNSFQNSLNIRNSFKLDIVNSIFYQFTYSVDQLLLLTKVLQPIAQNYCQKSLKEIIDKNYKTIGPERLYIIKQQAKRCYTIYNQLFQMFVESKKN